MGIHRDYVLRMIAEFFEKLGRIRALKKGQLWGEATVEIDEEFQRLMGAGVEAILPLSETELLARLAHDDATHVVRMKTAMLTALLKEAGDLAAAENRTEISRACYLKGLHLMLDTVACGDVPDLPEVVPQTEAFVLALGDAPLPLATLARLMRHYESTGQFGRAEDALYAMLELAPGEPALVDLGLAFYSRLAGQTDANLTGGNLPRAELEAGRAALQRTAVSRAAG